MRLDFRKCRSEKKESSPKAENPNRSLFPNLMDCHKEYLRRRGKSNYFQWIPKDEKETPQRPQKKQQSPKLDPFGVLFNTLCKEWLYHSSTSISISILDEMDWRSEKSHSCLLKREASRSMDVPQSLTSSSEYCINSKEIKGLLSIAESTPESRSASARAMHATSVCFRIPATAAYVHHFSCGRSGQEVVGRTKSCRI